MRKQAIQILLVDDDEIDTESVVRALRRLPSPLAITTVSNGLEALAALRGEGGCQRLARPYIVLLDLNMPRMNGIEFLQTLRQDPELRSSIVFVFTTSNNVEDMLAAYAEQIAGYFLKTSVTRESFELSRLIEHYCKIVNFPPAH